MSDWTKIEMKHEATRRMLRRACRARGVDASTTDLYRVSGMRYRTDGVATLAVVTLHEMGTRRPGGSWCYGYGVAVRAVEDEHNEHAGANAALKSAMECAATVIAHRCATSRMRVALDAKLEAMRLVGDVARSMQDVLAESDRERQRP